VHDHSMLLFEHKQAGTNPLSDGFGNKDWQVIKYYVYNWP